MLLNNLETIFTNIKKTNPLMHNISNIVTVNDCANITLAANGSPIVIDYPEEAAEVTSICTGLVINMGSVNENLMSSMLLAGKRSNELNHPVVLDPVGAGISATRNNLIKSLLDTVKFSVIRGNISEIKYIADGTSSANGVDAAAADKVTHENIDTVIAFAKDLSKATGAVIAISGEIDIISDSTTAYIIKNGHEMMAKVTGTGCMLSSLVGVFICGNPDNILEATAAAIGYFGYCGEQAYNKVIKENSGTSSFRTYLIDYVSQMDYNRYIGGAKIEIR